MPAAARALLDGAAVAGEPFDPELAAAAAGLDAADALAPLDLLVAGDLVCATGDGRAFRCRHPLLRRAVYDAAPPAWRLAAHERVAAALQARGAGASVRAFHVEKCARPGDDGGSRCYARPPLPPPTRRPATAARWYAAGARLLPCAEREQRAELLGPMALALANAGRLHESREALLGRVAHVYLRSADAGAARDRRPVRRRRAPARPPRRRAPALARRARRRAARGPRRARARDGRRRLLCRGCRRDARLGRPCGPRRRRGRTRSAPAPRASARSAPSAPATRPPPRRCSARAIDRLARIEDPEIGAGLKGAVHVVTAALLGERVEGRLRDARPCALRSPARRARTACSASSRSRAPSPAAAAQSRRGARRRRGRGGGRPAAGRPQHAPPGALDQVAPPLRPWRGQRGGARGRGVGRAARRARGLHAHPHRPLRRRGDPRGAGPGTLHSRDGRRRRVRCSKASTRRGGPGSCSCSCVRRSRQRGSTTRATGRPSWPATPRRWRSPPAPCALPARRPRSCWRPATPAEAGGVAMAAAERAGRIGARRDELAARLLAGRALAGAGDRTEAVALLRAVTVDAARGGAGHDARRGRPRAPAASAPACRWRTGAPSAATGRGP